MWHDGKKGVAFGLAMLYFWRTPEVLAQGDGVPHRGDAVGMKLGAQRGPVAEADSEPAGRRAHLVDERPNRRGHSIGIAQRGPRRCVQQSGAVPHGASKCVLRHESAVYVPKVRPQGVASTSGLEPKDPTARGGDAN